MAKTKFSPLELYDALESAVFKCLTSPRYQSLPMTGGAEAGTVLEGNAGLPRPRAQARAIATAIFENDALKDFPGFAAVHRDMKIDNRNRRIVNGFTGNNLSELAEEFELSERQIRRIVEQFCFDPKREK